MRGKRIWTYNEWYLDEAGVEQPMIPTNKIVMGSRAARAVRNYGAIVDLELQGSAALRFWPKSWITKDPSTRWLLMQSAPLPVINEPDAFAFATVI